MKRYALILISVLFLATGADAQYRINKSKYENSRFTYSYQAGDPYHPKVAGLTSFFVPGLGQMISGEIGRGFIFFGSFLGCIEIASVGFKNIQLVIVNDKPFVFEFRGGGLFVLGIMGILVIDIWSIIDANQVAIVNNLVFRDRNKTAYNIQILPYLDISNYRYNSVIPAGLSLKVSF